MRNSELGRGKGVCKDPEIGVGRVGKEEMRKVGHSLVRETTRRWSRGRGGERGSAASLFYKLESEFIRVAVYPIFARRWFPSARRCLSELRKYEFAPAEQLKEAQWLKLSSLVQHVSQNVPYYRELFRQQGLEAQDIRTFEDFSQIPILTKSVLQTRLSHLIAENRRAAEGRLNASGGSTGQPVQFYQDANYWDMACASDWLVAQWWGIRPGDRTASIWGCDRDLPLQTWRERLHGVITQTRVCNAFALTERQMEEFGEMLSSWQPRYITGYASALEILARFLLERRNVRIRPRVIRATAEVLGDAQRGLIEQAFQCPVYNFYGSREVNNLAAECPAQSGLHVNAPSRYIEVVDSAGNPAAAGAPGRILLTDLTNYFMPFLRYEVGDVGSWNETPCRCGRPFPILSRIWGRSSDFIVTSSGKLIHGEFFTHIFYDLTQVSSFQLVQKSLQEICVSVVLRPGEKAFGPELLRSRMEQALGPAVRVEIQIVGKIERPPSGKHRFVISHVPAPWEKDRFCEDGAVLDATENDSSILNPGSIS